MTLPAIAPLRPQRSAIVPVGPEWIYELKLDGFRGLLEIEHGAARFTSKTSRHMRRFDPLAISLARSLGVKSAILDGELLVMGDDGPDFYALMFHRHEPAYAAFDLLWLDGRDLRPLPLWRRKKMLCRLVDPTPIGFVDSVSDPALFHAVTQRNLEGIVAKRRIDPYCNETRWVKVKYAGYTMMEGRWELFARR